MRNVAEALRRLGKEANVPMPWRTLSGVLHPLRGNMAICLAEPGVGKSAFSLNWAASITQPSLVLSLDTDLASQAVRLAAMTSGTPMDTIKQDPEVWADYLERKVKMVRMYDLSISSNELYGLLEAETEYWGHSPALTVVDNIGNLVRDGSFEDYRRAFSDLHRVAREFDTFVLALHHVRRNTNRGPLRPTMASGQYTGEQEAEIVLGLFTEARDRLQVSILKNRSGQSDPNGEMHYPLHWNRDTMKLSDFSERQRAFWALGGMYGQRQEPSIGLGEGSGTQGQGPLQASLAAS